MVLYFKPKNHDLFGRLNQVRVPIGSRLNHPLFVLSLSIQTLQNIDIYNVISIIAVVFEGDLYLCPIGLDFAVL
jgi:hypothetical protein